MRICYISNNFEIHDYRFLCKLEENNYEVHAISLKKSKINNRFYLNGIKYYEYCSHRKLYQVRFNGLNPIWFVSAFKFVNTIINKVKPDIIHGGYASISGFISALTGFHPFLLMPWGSDILSDPKKNFIINKLVRYSVKKADLITCDAESVKEEIINRYHYSSNNIIVFPWGIDLKLFNPKNNKRPLDLIGWEDKITVVCTRQHKEIYGIKYLINAIPNIVKENKNIRFLFIGDGPLTDSFKAIINNNNLAEFVKFTGRIENTQIPFYLSNSNIYVSPSLSDGSSLSLLEAFACGLPAIVTNIRANREWVKEFENGLLVPTKNSRELSKAILKLARNKELCFKMKQTNLKLSKNKANWDLNFDALTNIYNLLLSS